MSTATITTSTDRRAAAAGSALGASTLYLILLEVFLLGH
jgi:hypothetical protein